MQSKYHFDQHLSSVGDWVETDPIPHEDYLKLKYAALIWAKRRGYKVSTTVYYTTKGYVCRIKLLNKWSI